MEYNIYILFLIFFIYSVIGYIVESTYTSIVRKQVTFSRGFLIGPYLPIFGFGGLFLTVYLKKYSNDLIALFVMSAASCMILEYFSSYILEKIFKENYSILDVTLHTGKTHQIRAHLAHIGHPIIGDGKYGNNEINKKFGVKSQELDAYKIIFNFSTDAKILNYLKGFSIQK